MHPSSWGRRRKRHWTELKPCKKVKSRPDPRKAQHVSVGQRPIGRASEPRRTTMFRRSVVALAVLSLCSLPAFAATEYWVAKSASTKKCEVVTKKPDGKTLIEVGMASHKNKKEAETAMKTAAECK